MQHAYVSKKAEQALCWISEEKNEVDRAYRVLEATVAYATLICTFYYYWPARYRLKRQQADGYGIGRRLSQGKMDREEWKQRTATARRADHWMKKV